MYSSGSTLQYQMVPETIQLRRCCRCIGWKSPDEIAKVKQKYADIAKKRICRIQVPYLY